MNHNNPVFSFLMCTYNDDSLLEKAISSLTSQSFQNWELIVLDNSNKTDKVWDALCEFSRKDNRIHCFRGEESVGWAKGTSLCLRKAKGQYMTFLASDDFISDNALEKLYDVIQEHNPDIIWVGMEYIYYEDNKMISKGEAIPEYKVYGKENRSETIYDIMSNIYYNSMFHFEKIEFLNKHNIDFFYPYYGDCAGMTKAMTVADTMVSMNETVYYLSMSTSQTYGHYIWDGYKIFISQWDSIKTVFLKEWFSQLDKINYVAMRLGANQIAVMSALCDNHCRNDFMNPINKNASEILMQITDILSDTSILEMMYYYGRKSYTDEILNLLEKFGNHIGLEQFCQLEKNWIWRIMNVCLEYKDEMFRKVFVIKEEDLDYLINIILDEDNHGAFGLEIMADSCNYYSDTTILNHHEQLQKAIKKYRNFEQEIVSQFHVVNDYNT